MSKIKEFESRVVSNLERLGLVVRDSEDIGYYITAEGREAGNIPVAVSDIYMNILEAVEK